MEQLVVTGTRLPAISERLSSSLTVFDRAAIEARNDADAVDLLRAVPGLQVTQPGGRAGVASAFMRGGEPNFIVFLIDGIQVNDPNNTRGGSFDVGTLNMDDVERIEIVRGPQSAIYGSDALSGAINVITRGGGGTPSATVETEVGGDDYRHGLFTVSGPLGNGASAAFRAATIDDGDPVEGSNFDLDTLAGKLQWAFVDDWRMNVYGRYANTDAKAFPEDSGGPEFAVIREVDQKRATDYSLGSDLNWQVSETWELVAVVNYYEREESYASPGVAPGVRDGVPPNANDSDLKRSHASLRAALYPLPGLEATVGADWEREDGTTSGWVELEPGVQLPTAFALERDTVGLYGEARYAVADGWILQGSLRRDDPDGTSDQTTGKLGVVWQLFGGQTELRANWGKGFKLPSFFALGNPLVGNPDLLPEKSESIDFGIRQALAGDRVITTLDYFSNELTDLIDFDAELFTSVNRTRVDTQGVEFALDVRATEGLSLSAQLTYTDIDVRQADIKLRQRPEWRGGANLNWVASDAWQFNFNWLYVDDTFDSAIPTGPATLDGYQRVDAGVRWQATGHLAFALAVENLLDEHYEEAIGFPGVGRRARLSASYRFGA